MKKQMTKIAMMLILIIGLTVGAAKAQIDVGGFGPVGIYDGVETSEGIFEPMSAMCYGNTYVLNSTGEWESYHLTVSIDYLKSGINPIEGFSVTGGTWSLVVVRDNQYAGTLYGEIRSGSLIFTTNGNGEAIKLVSVNLISTGGLGMFNGKEGENISGVLNATTDLRSKETTGSAIFNF